MRKAIHLEQIEPRIFLIRGHKVMLSHDLAGLYGVRTKVLIQAVKRNLSRFPEDFMFVLRSQELVILRSQIVTSSWGGIRYAPHAFTEQGIAMLSSVLKSEKAIQVNIIVMRAFVKLRQVLAANQELAYKFQELERKVETHDQEIRSIFEAIRRLMEPPPEKPKPQIGFRP